MLNKPEKIQTAVLNKYIRYLPHGQKEQLQMIRYKDGTISCEYKLFSDQGKVLATTQLTPEQAALFDWRTNVWGYIRENGGWRGFSSDDKPYENIPDMRGKDWLTQSQLAELDLERKLLSE